MTKIVILLLILTHLASTQVETNTKGFIETRSLFLFDATNGNQANSNGTTYSFNFNRNFTLIPRVGLSIYTMDFEYSPSFSCQVSSSTTVSSTSLVITTSNTGNNDQLYIMYIATDHDFMGVFMPGPLITYLLNQGNPQVTQSFVFNFKQQISVNSLASDIRLSVYLTGIVSTSELVSNGYPTNHTYFSISGKVLSSTNYQIDVTVQSTYGDITISQVQYTIVYFDTTIMLNFRYQMDAGAISLQNYGGTADASSKSISINPLAYNSSFYNLQIFYGISALECEQGASIIISASNSIFTNPVNNASQVILTMQTWQLTFVIQSSYNFIQYQSLKCDLPGSNCDSNCATSTQPHYSVNGVCNYCQITCLTCNVSDSSTQCDTCDPTRYLSNTSKLCLCKSGYYDSQTSYVCYDCFPCLTCNLQNVCLSCSSDLHLVLNQILSKCECGPGYFANYIIPANQTFNRTNPCSICFDNCLQCLNSSYCLACNMFTYLTDGQCYFICNSNQKYNATSGTCIQTSDVMFDQTGRLAYSWTYTADLSVLNIILTFSQANIMFYYYQNGIGYSQASNNNFSSQMGTAQFYYDDGAYSAGFASSSASASQISFTSLNSNVDGIFGNSNLSNASKIALANSVLTGNIIQSYALNGSYYGLGEPLFFKYLYQNYIQLNNITNYYDDQYGIPYGKYNLTTNAVIANPNFVDALSNNMILSIDNQIIPFTINANSNNQFTMTASVTKSYFGDNGYIILKNPALVRSGPTASEVWNVSTSIYIYDCTIPSYVAAATNIYDSNSIIIQVLWGLGKYPLFVGFGWIFMPLMLVLQYIMSLNYIDTVKPLNLEMFLKSFADFRNPSIFYNPLRNNIDTSIVSHSQIYTVIPIYYIFDRGIDFMKNCFQFYFIPFLSFALFILLFGFNKLLNISCRRDIPLISQYLAQRLPLQLAAYTLVQALPVSFFFFAQLNDTRFSGPNQPNASYPIFNVAMAYGAFFLTCAIPLILMAYIHSIYSAKENQVKSAKDFKLLFTNLLQSLPHHQHKAGLDNPLWTGDPIRIISYGFGVSVFYLAILYGFFTSFFISSYPWQFTGLILITAVFLAFTAVGDQFQNRFIKYFWIIFAALMIAFLLLLAGIGSNASVAPCDQQNMGYLGIGFLYLIILASLVACGILFWLTGFEIYQNYFQQRPIIVNLDEKVDSQLGEPPQRIKTIQFSTKLKSTYLRNPMSQMGIGSSKMNIENMNMGEGIKEEDQNLPSQERMIIREVDEENPSQMQQRQELIFVNLDEKTGEYFYRIKNGKGIYRFDSKMGRLLREKEPIYIDSNNQLYNCNLINIGNYATLYANRRQKHQSAPDFEAQLTINEHFQQQPSHLRKINQQNQYNQLNSEKNRYDNSQRIGWEGQINKNQADSDGIAQIVQVNGQQYTKLGQDKNGKLILRNDRTKEIKYFDPGQIDKEYKIQRGGENMMQFGQRNDMTLNSKRTIINKLAVISPEIEKNQVILTQNRKINVNGEQYQDLGEENGQFKLYNFNKKTEIKVPRQDYIQMNLQSFSNRVNINGVDYDFNGIGSDQNVHLLDTDKRTFKVITQDQFLRVKQQNQQKLRTMKGSDFRAHIEQALSSYNSFSKNTRQQIPPNVLLLQSKASEGVSGYTEKISHKFIQHEIPVIYNKSHQQVSVINYTSQSRRQLPQHQQHQQELIESEDFTISKIIQRSPGPGPFKLCVLPKNKIIVVEEEETFKEQDVIQTKKLNDQQFHNYMRTVNSRFPDSVVFMTDMSNQHQYIL